MNSAVFYLVFDEILGPTPVITYLLPGGVTPNTAYVEYDQNVMIIAPTNLSLTGVYTFTVQDGSVKDQNFNVDPEHISFSVDLENGLPPVAPHMVATSFWTGDSQTSVTPGARLQFLFSATGLSKGAGIMELHTADGALVKSIDVASAGTDGSLYAGGFALTFWGLPLHSGQSYYLYVPAGILVGSGGPSQAFTYHFTAAGALDLTPPVLASSSPADNQSLAPLTGDIELTFNEPIKLGSGNFGIYRASDNSLVKTIAASSASVDTDGQTVILTTGVLLDQATQYYLLADTGSVLDMSDNAYAGISASSVLNFITAPLQSLPSDTQPWAVSGNAQLAAGRILSVTHDGQYNNEFALALEPPQDGTEFVFFNYGSIRGAVSGFPGIMAGVFIDSGIAQIYHHNAFFRNYGDITVSGDMAALGGNNIGSLTGDAAVGVYDPSGYMPNLENAATGTINAVAWRAWGIYQNGGSGNPVNLGTINVHGSDQAYGYYTIQNISPSFINSGVISVHGGNGNTTAGVYSEFGSFTRVENSGRIEVWADSNSQNAIGIGMGDGPPESIINSGVISAPIAIKVRANNGLSVLSIVNTGQITGDVYMGAGASNVFDGSGGTYSGTIHGGQGANTIHAGAGDSILVGGLGNDTLDGGPGFDKAIYNGNSTSYGITKLGNGSFTITGAWGTDTLTSIEKLVFDDLAISGGAPVPANLSGEGHSDLVWQNIDGHPVVWLMNGTAVLDQVAVGSNPGPSWHVKGTGDFNGDGYADILWQNDNAQAAIWFMNGTSVAGSALVGSNPVASWHIKGAGDFDGDGKSDILWQLDSGQALLWLMNGSAIAGIPPIGSNPGPTWHVKGAGDFNGDGKSDILWQNDSGQAAVWLVSDTTLHGGAPGGGVVGGDPGPTWHVVGAGDFDGDFKSDILWQNDSGQVAIWLMNGSTVIGGGAISTNPGPGWQAKGTADLDGDGKSDILWQSASGQALGWLMNGTTIANSSLLGSNPGPNWQVANYGAVARKMPGDFDGDHNADLLWQNDSGQAAVWLMNGTNMVGGGGVSPTPSPSWHVKGASDFDSDGKSDILWQNDNGQAAVWLMNGSTLVGGGTISNNPDPSWHVIAGRDFDSDGKTDILWQNNSGQVAIWFMNGANLASGAVLSVSPDPSWHIKAAADFDGDGKSDILWQNDNGQAAIWLMNGTTIAGSATVGGNPGTSWHVMGSGDFNGDGKSDMLWQNDNGQAHIWLMNGTQASSTSDIGANPGASWRVKGTADINSDGLSDILWQNSSGQAMAWLMSGTNVLSTPTIGSNPGATWHMIASSS